MTKKEFLEKSHITKYTSGGKNIIAIFHDWEEGTYTEDGIEKIYAGYKYMFSFENITNEDAINEMYNRIYRLGELNDSTFKIKHIPLKTRIAAENKYRFRIPLTL